MEGFLGEIRMFGGDYAPKNWAFCDGQLLPTSSYSGLFTVIGKAYGGDGRTTFALPDMRGRASIHVGNGKGLSNRELAAVGGVEESKLDVTQLPSHNHVATLHGINSDGDKRTPKDRFIAGDANTSIYSDAGAADSTLNSKSITIDNAGGSQPVNNMQPYLALNYIICVQGILAARS